MRRRVVEVLLWLLLLWVAVTFVAMVIGFFMPLPEDE